MFRRSAAPVASALWVLSAAVPAAADPMWGLDAFVGEFQGHGGVIRIDAEGNGSMVVRTYRWCGQPVDKDGVPCDDAGGGLNDSGLMTFRVTEVRAVDGDVAAFLTVLTDNDPASYRPGARLKLTFYCDPNPDPLRSAAFANATALGAADVRPRSAASPSYKDLGWPTNGGDMATAEKAAKYCGNPP